MPWNHYVTCSVWQFWKGIFRFRCTFQLLATYVMSYKRIDLKGDGKERQFWMQAPRRVGRNWGRLKQAFRIYLMSPGSFKRSQTWAICSNIIDYDFDGRGNLLGYTAWQRKFIQLFFTRVASGFWDILLNTLVTTESYFLIHGSLRGNNIE